MNKIKKRRNPPQSFQEIIEKIKDLESPFRDGLPTEVKTDLRNALAKEQKFICPYCERSLIDVKKSGA